MAPTTAVRCANRLIGALPPMDQRRILARCAPVELAFAEDLGGDGDCIRHVYFPTQSFITLVMPLDDGCNLAVGMVGDEGMLGIPLMLGMDASRLRSIVQGAGTALLMEAPQFRRELARSRALSTLLQRYLYVLIGQLEQTAACTRFHVLEARLARWLLMTEDRAHSREFHVTHEFLAFMLGVRRVGVTKAASALQRSGLIDYHRGTVTILDRIGLEAHSCGCYAADSSAYAQVMGARARPKAAR